MEPNHKNHIYEDIESPNKSHSNLNTTFSNNSKFVIKNTRKSINIANKNSNNIRMDQNKMLIKPDSFFGQGDIKTCIIQYEKVDQINNWDVYEKIKCLSIYLKNTANKFLENLENKEGNWSWENLKSEFINELQPI